MKKYQLASLFWLISSVHGQNLVDIRTQTKNVDFSGAASTIPAKSGTALPATCNPGEMYFKTSNTPGQNLYGCAPANSWTELSGSTNGTVSAAASGQFGFYAGNGSTITGHTLSASDIPALSYQGLLAFTGSGVKTASSTGTLLTNDCAKWDVNGNVIDSGAPCASVANGTAGQFGFYSLTGNALAAHTLVASDIPALNYQATLSFTGSGTKTLSSTGAGTASNCAKWDANGNVIDAGGPCAIVSTGTIGQFAFYSAAGSALTAHTLGASDIPALNYQVPLSFTGTGTKTLSSTGAGTASNCAKWDANGNVIDAGGPCANVSTGTTGQFAFYSAAGSALTAHTLGASDIPTLNYQAPLSFTGTGTKTLSSTGAGTASNCAKWDANGNVIDAGLPCANVSTGATGQFAFYSAAGSALTAHTLAASDIPSLSYQALLSFTGTGTKTLSSTGAGTSNNCAKWDANGNVIDAGAPCGSGSGPTLTVPSATTVGNVLQYSNTSGTAVSIGLGLVTAVGSPGLDTNIPTEKSVRTAIAAAAVASGNLPSQTANAGYLITNGSSVSWGDMTTGPSGALCAGAGCSGGTSGIVDIVTSVVPRLAAANTFTGVNKFQQLQVTIYTVGTLPTCNSSFEGQMEGVADAVSPSYLATVTGGGSVHVPVYCNGTSWVAH